MLQFIDNAALDREAMRLIRSHAAKGKNIGKGRPKRTALLRPSIVKDARHADSLDIAPYLERQVFDSISMLPLAWELSRASRSGLRRLVDLFAVELWPAYIRRAIVMDMSQTMWIRYVFQDEAYFHCSVAMLNCVFPQPRTIAEDKHESMYHLNKALTLINQSLSGPEATAATTFASVIAMTHYHRLQGDYEQGIIHLDGLQRMAIVSGGVETLLESTPALAQKLFRTDLDFAMNLGMPTRFNVMTLPRQRCLDFLINYDTPTSPVPDEVLAVARQPLLRIFTMAARVSHIIRAAAHSKVKLGGPMLHDVFILIAYQLLDFCPLSMLPLSREVENLLFIGLCAFVLASLTALNGVYIKVPLLLAAARAAFNAEERETHVHIKSWALLMSRTTVLTDEDHFWLIGPSQQRRSEDRTRLKDFYPWLDGLHDEIYESMLSCGSRHGTAFVS